MPQRTNPFQQLVHLIEYQLAPGEATVTESKEFVDQVTGKKREVDIVIETKVGIHPFIIGIECRDRKKPADTPWIEEIAGKHQDIGVVNKTITVSSSGYYKPALDKAKQRKIVPLTLKEAEESDWVRYTNRLATLREMTIQSPLVQCKEVKVQVLPPSPPPYPPPPTIGSEKDTIVYDAADNPVGNVKQIVDSVIHTDPNFRAHIEGKATSSTDVPFDFIIWALDERYFVSDASGTKHRLAQLILRGECRLENTPVSLKTARYGSASVLHGVGEHLGQPIQVTWTEEEDGRMMFGASFGEPSSD